jgi:hypothetical protein
MRCAEKIAGVAFAWTDGDQFTVAASFARAARPDATGSIVNDANGTGGMTMMGIFVYEIDGAKARKTGHAGYGPCASAAGRHRDFEYATTEKRSCQPG